MENGAARYEHIDVSNIEDREVRRKIMDSWIHGCSQIPAIAQGLLTPSHNFPDPELEDIRSERSRRSTE